MIGILLFSLMAAVYADHPVPFLPFPRIEPVNKVYDFRFDPFLRRDVPIFDHRTIVHPGPILDRGLTPVLDRGFPILDRGLTPILDRGWARTAFPHINTALPVPIDGRLGLTTGYPFFNRGLYSGVVPRPVVRGDLFPFVDRLPHVPTTPIVSELPLPAPPAPLITSLDALPSPYPLLPATSPIVHPAPFTPFIPPSTLVAPLPVEIKEEDKKVERILEPFKIEVKEEKKEKIERKEIEPELKGEEKFSHEFVDEHGTIVKEEGALVDNVLIKKGRYSYKSPEGVPVEIKYIADQNGYRLL